jgi:uncharacterized membrane protein YedE/YeeE
MDEIPVGTIVATAGFLAGGVFGAVAHRTNFCTMGALSDIVYMGSYGRFRSWLLAIAVALIGSQALNSAGYVDLGESIYLTANFGWLGAIVGGLLFGFGMTMTGGCGNKILVRIGSGNLKSLVAGMFLGIFAYMTLRGLIGLARVRIEQAANIDLAAHGYETQSVAEFISRVVGGEPQVLIWPIVAVVSLAILWFCFKDREFRTSPSGVLGGLVVGLLIPVGWLVTGVLGRDDFDPTPLASFTFVAPTGDGIQYLMTFSGASINFGIATIGGVIVGSFLSATAAREFRFEAFSDSSDMLRHIVGGAIMGIGGVLALGCTIGQGLTGMSTLALGSVIAWLSIIAGGIYGLKYLEAGSFAGAFGLLFGRA